MTFKSGLFKHNPYTKIISIVSTGNAPGQIDLSDAAYWNTNKSMISSITFTTASTDYDVWLVQNDNGKTTDDARIPAIQIAVNENGNSSISLMMPYEDEDESKEVHLEYVDNSGANNIDIIIYGEERL